MKEKIACFLKKILYSFVMFFYLNIYTIFVILQSTFTLNLAGDIKADIRRYKNTAIRIKSSLKMEKKESE